MRDHEPLASRMRPRSINEFVGQTQIINDGAPISKLIEGEGSTSVILYGPPGTGKTTLAYLIAENSGADFVELSGISTGVKEIRGVIEKAKKNKSRSFLFVDEIHRLAKNQQETLLSAVEDGTITLVAATTENPGFSVIAPLLSRSLLLTLEPLKDDDIVEILERALNSENGFGGEYRATNDSIEEIARLSNGDARRALVYLEAIVGASKTKEITLEGVKKSINRAIVRYDRDGSEHYDVISAFIKSIRGSDVDAAIYYLARMLEAGEDPRFIARRLVIHASEDVGMADPMALQTCVAAYHSVSFIGMPEARLTLAQATIHLATAPKSNSAYRAINQAIDDVRKGIIAPVPPHLRSSEHGDLTSNKREEYKYPHNDTRGVLTQSYMPRGLENRYYYDPSSHGAEQGMREWLNKTRAILNGES